VVVVVAGAEVGPGAGTVVVPSITEHILAASGKTSSAVGLDSNGSRKRHWIVIRIVNIPTATSEPQVWRTQATPAV
jgi:hypothetical protein